MKETPIPAFVSEEEAKNWMYDHVDDPYTDNYRFAYKDDDQAMSKYVDIQSGGCCGDFDCDVLIAGRLATIGCNFGH